MTLFRATAFDTPDNPFQSGALRAASDLGLLVDDGGAITARGPFAQLAADHPGQTVEDLTDGLLLPGLIDTHVHFPQARVIGGLGMPLLQWLERCALPEEARMAQDGYAQAVAAEFTDGLTDSGTTTALVFGAHFAPAVELLFEAATARGLRVTSGLVVSDRMLREDLHTTPQRAYDEGLALARRWHGTGRNRYAVTPRFSLSCSDELLASCAQLRAEIDGSWFTSHINENTAEVSTVEGLFGCSYADSYDRHGLLDRRSVLAHNVHATDGELACMAQRGCVAAHCPTSNAALGSGLFALRDHLAHGVRVALGSDVGAGTGYSLFKEGLQAYFIQQLRGDTGEPLDPAKLLYLATAAGADALGLSDQVGDLSVGKRFDALWVRPAAGTPLDVSLRHAPDADQALARTFALATSGDVAGVWIDGDRVKG